MRRTGTPWDQAEVEATVADYLSMLRLEIRGQDYNKSEHRRRLATFLRDRSHTAIERKRQNISAVLLGLQLPCVSGYKPLGNYQAMLEEVVLDQVLESVDLLKILERAVRQPPRPPHVDDILRCWTEPPDVRAQTRAREVQLPFRAARVNYLEREAQNSALGEAGGGVRDPVRTG